MRQNPLFSACGLNCGLCPRYYTEGSSRCPGCGGPGFSAKHPPCGLISCCQRHSGLEYCYLCEEYPCKKYEGAGLKDSFITHKNQLQDLDKAKIMGNTAYQTMLDKKMKILQELLQNYNDGRRKNFFCLAVNLLELQDITLVMAEIVKKTKNDGPSLKEKAALAVAQFQAMAEKRNIIIKLRK